MHTNSLYIFTGGPGSGKTTTLDALAALGYNIIPELFNIKSKKKAKLYLGKTNSFFLN